MKKIIVACMAYLLTLTTYAQNLVPNPSFEEYDTCPSSISSLSYANGWINPSGYSPDYFNVCDTGNFAGVPSNTFGYQTARTGNAYAGIITMIETDSREYIRAQLISPLVANYTYEVTFYVAVSDISTYASNDIGAYLANTAGSFPNSVLFLPYIPQIENESSSNHLNIENTWVKVFGTYMAQGGERFITIGNFKNDTNTDTVTLNPDGDYWNASYHYIDDVSVVCQDCPVGTSEIPEDSELSLYPNPTNENLNIDFENNTTGYITVYTPIGISILQVEISNRSSYVLNTNSFPQGVYFFKAEVSDQIIVKQFLVNH